MKRHLTVIISLFMTILFLTGCQKELLSVPAYPLTKEIVEEALKDTKLPCVVSEETFDTATRTSIELRDEEGRLIAGISSSEDGEDARFLGMSLISSLQAREATVHIPEEQWPEMIQLATVLYGGFENAEQVAKDFVTNYEVESIVTEYDHEGELTLNKSYEWMKDYGHIFCNFEVSEDSNGTRSLTNIGFYNSPIYQTSNSEMRAKTQLSMMFMSMTSVYESYKEATGGQYSPLKIDTEFLESDYSKVYTAKYQNYCTEECMQNMEAAGLFTMIDYFADRAEAVIMMKDVTLTESEETREDKNKAKYSYEAKVSCEKNGTASDFDVTGTITVENIINGWKVSDVTINDTDLLSEYICAQAVFNT